MLQRAASSVSDKPKSIKPKRSTSFGRFDGLRNHQSPSKHEENGDAELTEGESGAESFDRHRSLGKKMKAISLTMRKKMGKKYVKAHSGDMGENSEDETESGSPADKSSDRPTNSLESLHSGQFSSSEVTGRSEDSSNRDSLRMEEVPYTGQFCGRARVHTAFVPSPYDTDSLKLKVGDIIDVISKPPMGIWTGMLNNKVGNFKFIYVDVLVEVETEEEVPKIRPQSNCKRPRPKTLLELLERLQLEEYASSLLLNGYQSVEDMRHLREKHLIELNMTDPDHRSRLLAATACLCDTARDDLTMKDDEDEEENDCPRDSGCFIPSECAENSKEDTESHRDAPNLSPAV